VRAKKKKALLKTYKLDETTNSPKARDTLPKFLNRIQMSVVFWALDQARQSRTEAARILGIKRTTLVEMLNRHNSKRDVYRLE